MGKPIDLHCKLLQNAWARRDDGTVLHRVAFDRHGGNCFLPFEHASVRRVESPNVSHPSLKLANENVLCSLLFVGGIISLISVLLCSFVTNPTVFIYLYSFGFGIGKGFMYSSALASAWTHLPGRKGAVSGIIISGFGFGGFFFGIITNKLCNPDNVSVVAMETRQGHKENFFPAEVAQNVPSTLRYLDLIWLCLFVFGMLTITTYQGPAYSEHDDQSPVVQQQDLREINSTSTRQYELRQSLLHSHSDAELVSSPRRLPPILNLFTLAINLRA
jgi:hypothetical protein